jgi:hypothetical protein
MENTVHTTEHLLVGLSSIIVLGIGAQWLAWRYRFPSLLLLLALGFAVGPASGFIDPDALFGKLLFPFISISVAIILFEGGRTSDLVYDECCCTDFTEYGIAASHPRGCDACRFRTDRCGAFVAPCAT